MGRVLEYGGQFNNGGVVI